MSDSLGIQLQESSVKTHETEGAPPTFDVLETAPPANNNYLYPDPPPLSGARMKRIRKEHAILQSSLPEGIFVRTWESRLDLLRILIVGPLDTPYEYAPFVIDIRIPPDYPHSPPDAFFHSWTSGQGPVNPNLYENGKICLSLLGTWHAGEKGEAWSPARSTILQVLVSILGLVLVKEPYYNEAGFEARAGSEDAKIPSQLYSERTYFRTRAFITHAVRNGVPAFDDLIQWLYVSQKESAPKLLEKAVEGAKELMKAGEGGVDIRAGLSRMSKGALMMLERQLKDMEGLMAVGEGMDQSS
jgi:ubiquitin-conjugating enzyme E2 O